MKCLRCDGAGMQRIGRFERFGRGGTRRATRASWRRLCRQSAWGLAVALAGAGAAPLPGLASAARGAGRALLIGVNACPEFELPDGRRPRPLRGAENDVATMASLLRDGYGFPDENIERLTGSAATHDAIVASLRRAARTLSQNDVFVFHFSGHGTQVEDRRPFDEEDRVDEALCPFDAGVEGRGLILDDALGVLLEDLPARHVTVILDCCHAGTGAKQVEPAVAARFLPGAAARPPTPSTTPSAVPGAAARPPQPSWRELQPGGKGLSGERFGCFACQPGQQAYERRILGRGGTRHVGQFTHYLAAGLDPRSGRPPADEDADGVVTYEEAHRFVTRQLDQRFNRLQTDAASQQQPLLQAPRASVSFLGRSGAGRP